MNLEIHKTNTIQDLFSWLKYAEPAGGKKQWKEGRSAMEFARYMTQKKDFLPIEIEKYLLSIGIKGKKYTCQPEHVTSYEGYDLGSGSGRHHDGLLTTSDAVIGIEAKVSESFDKSVKEKLDAAVKKSDKGFNTKKRIIKSIELFTGNDYSEFLNEIENLNYQLISATTGTLIEAHKANIGKAIVLILEFVGDIDYGNNKAAYDDQMNANATAFENFLEFLNIKDKDDKHRKITANVKGKNIDIWFKKMTISISKADNNYTLIK